MNIIKPVQEDFLFWQVSAASCRLCEREQPAMSGVLVGAAKYAHTHGWTSSGQCAALKAGVQAQAAVRVVDYGYVGGYSGG